MKRSLLSTAVVAALVAAPLTVATADTAGLMVGPVFERNVSDTPELRSSKAKIDGFQFYVPARDTTGDTVDVRYLDASGRLVETRNEARPLLSVYIDDSGAAGDPVVGDDVWAAYSLDDGDTWQRTNLSMVADRSSFKINKGQETELRYPGVVSKPVLSLKGNRAVVAWTSTYCESGFPGYESSTEDLHGVAGDQRSVDYTLQGFPEVGEVPYKCLWAARGKVDTVDGSMTWYQPERLTSGTRYAMQLAINSAPGTGFVLAWGEDPAGLAPGSGSGPGEGWTGASPNPGTDVWYSSLPMSSFDQEVLPSPEPHPDDPGEVTSRPRPANTFDVPVPVSDNAAATLVGATRPFVAVAPYTFKKADGSTGNGSWVGYGYEETKEGLASETDPEQGKRVIHHWFGFDDPDEADAGFAVSPDGQSARRVRYISQPYGQMESSDSRTIGVLIYRTGTEGHAGSADFMMHRFEVPESDDALVDNPFRADLMVKAPTNVSATTALATAPDPVTGETRTTRWIQTADNLDDDAGAAALESARGHRGMLKGDFLALGYLWTPNWDLFLKGRDVENYYVRRSFDGGATFTSAPAAAPYGGDGVRSCRYFNDPSTGARLKPVCSDVDPGEFEPAQNLSRLDGFDESAIEPRLPGLPGTIPGASYPDDVQDVSVLWQAWGTGLPKSPDGIDPEDGDPDVPVPDEGSGKGPLDIWFTLSQDYGDTYLRNASLADGSSAQAEVQMRFSPDGSKMYAVWNDYGPDGALDVQFRRVTPDVFPYNTVEGGLGFTTEVVEAVEGDEVRIDVVRTGGRRGEVGVDWATVDGTATAGTHYTTAGGTLTFAHGDVGPRTIVVPTVDNDLDGPNGDFRVELSNPTGGAWVERSPLVVNVLDDEDFTAPRSRATSPRVTDRATVPVTYTAADDESGVDRVLLYARAPGSDVFRKVAVDSPADGRVAYRTGGRNGVYRFYTVAVDRVGNRERAPARADAVTGLDTVAPRLRDITVRPTRFDISRDRFVRASFRLSERARVRLVVRQDGRLVRAADPTWKPAGPVVRRWYGHDDQGHLVKAGRYLLVIRATDVAGNATSRRFGVTVRR